MTLGCGHVYHQDCIKSLCQARDVDVTQLPCPVCKNTSSDMQRLENRLGHTVLPQSWEVLLAESPPRQDEEVVGVALGSTMAEEEEHQATVQEPVVEDQLLAETVQDQPQETAVTSASASGFPDYSV